MKAKRITDPAVCFSVVRASVTWLYPSTDGKVNQQTLRSGIRLHADAVTTPASSGKLIVNPSAALWVEFQGLRKEWRAKRGVSSSIQEMSMLEPYQKIIAMGKDIVPHILAQLKAEGDEPDQWFWALRVITNSNPVLPQDQGDFVAMAKAWIDWGEKEESAAYVG